MFKLTYEMYGCIEDKYYLFKIVNSNFTFDFYDFMFKDYEDGSFAFHTTSSNGPESYLEMKSKEDCLSCYSLSNAGSLSFKVLIDGSLQECFREAIWKEKINYNSL